MFDPWNATLADALAENKRRGNSSASREFLTAKGVSKLKTRVEAGDGGAILFGISSCLRECLTPPEWLRQAFCDRVFQVEIGKVDSWSHPDAFGEILTKGEHSGAAFRRNSRKLEAWAIACELRTSNPLMAIDRGFFEEVMSRMSKGRGKNRSYVEKYYYEAKRSLESLGSDDALEKALDNLFGELTDPGNFKEL